VDRHGAKRGAIILIEALACRSDVGTGAAQTELLIGARGVVDARFQSPGQPRRRAVVQVRAADESVDVLRRYVLERLGRRRCAIAVEVEPERAGAAVL